MRFHSLASCSKAGSAYLIEGADGTKVLVDCGLGIRRLETRLREAGVEPVAPDCHHNGQLLLLRRLWQARG